MVPPIDSPDEKSQRIDSKLLNIKKISDVKTAVALQHGPLAQMLAALDIDTPIPQEAFSAVAEILSYVYKANGQPDPFNAIFDRPLDRNDKGDTNQT
ncbi:MAG: EscU/YscU/HrcU family type III secretion system export apparatus switch protein [Alphaproteobacteria bacterium]|nr:EscU/YscU/HrcU family type III secretion system export apparatus switch protein [Alphaproteobacteria bacterium]